MEMKINIGCGSVYKRGFVNVDGFDSTVADSVMNAYDLEFKDNVAGHIECTHMLEHLGVVQGIYAISEFYRVLKPGGTLKIATPDVEQAFENFTRRKFDDRKYLMNWIYGLDTPGMNHRYGYPEELLRILLSESGFVAIETKKRSGASNYPEILARCKKPLRSDAFELIAKFRHDLVRKKIIHLDNQVIGLDQDRVVQRLTQTILEISPNDEIPLHVITDICIESPSICLAYLQFLQNLGYPIATHSIDGVEQLEKVKFPEILAYLLEQLPDSYTLQEEALSSILDIGHRTAAKMLDPSKRESTIKQLEVTISRIDSPHGLSLFSEESIQLASNHIFSLGLKAFANMDHEKALSLFRRSSSLNRSNLLAIWNLARVTAILIGTTESLRVYEILLHNPSLYVQMPDYVIALLRKEMRSAEEGDLESLEEPLYSIPY